jgi:hypothetical protein
MRLQPKSDTRKPKSEGSPKSEARHHRSPFRCGRGLAQSATPRQLPFSKRPRSNAVAGLHRISDFGLPSGFGIRVSDFTFPAFTDQEHLRTVTFWDCFRSAPSAILWPVGK